MLVDAAIHLVMAMEIDRAALFALQAPYVMEQQKNMSRKEKDFLECLKSSSPSNYTNIYADEIVNKMAEEEIQEAIIFFESSAGKKINQNGFIQAYKMIGVNSNEKIKDFSDKEIAQIEEFKKTTAGGKVFSKTFFSSDTTQKLIDQKNEQIISGCIAGSK